MEEAKVFVKISAKTLADLLTRANKLAALESGGVDNWTWYGESIHEFENEYGSIECTVEEVLKNYEGII